MKIPPTSISGLGPLLKEAFQRAALEDGRSMSNWLIQAGKEKLARQKPKPRGEMWPKGDKND